MCCPANFYALPFATYSNKGNTITPFRPFAKCESNEGTEVFSFTESNDLLVYLNPCQASLVYRVGVSWNRWEHFWGKDDHLVFQPDYTPDHTGTTKTRFKALKKMIEGIPKLECLDTVDHNTLSSKPSTSKVCTVAQSKINSYCALKGAIVLGICRSDEDCWNMGGDSCTDSWICCGFPEDHGGLSTEKVCPKSTFPVSSSRCVSTENDCPFGSVCVNNYCCQAEACPNTGGAERPSAFDPATGVCIPNGNNKNTIEYLYLESRHGCCKMEMCPGEVLPYEWIDEKAFTCPPGTVQTPSSTNSQFKYCCPSGKCADGWAPAPVLQGHKTKCQASLVYDPIQRGCCNSSCPVSSAHSSPPIESTCLAPQHLGCSPLSMEPFASSTAATPNSLTCEVGKVYVEAQNGCCPIYCEDGSTPIQPQLRGNFCPIGYSYEFEGAACCRKRCPQGGAARDPLTDSARTCDVGYAFNDEVNACCQLRCPDSNTLPVPFNDFLPKRCPADHLPDTNLNGCCPYNHPCTISGTDSKVPFDLASPSFCPRGYKYDQNINSCCGWVDCPVTGASPKAAVSHPLNGFTCQLIKHQDFKYFYVPSLNGCCPVCDDHSAPGRKCSSDNTCTAFDDNYECKMEFGGDKYCCSNDGINHVHPPTNW